MTGLLAGADQLPQLATGRPITPTATASYISPQQGGTFNLGRGNISSSAIPSGRGGTFNLGRGNTANTPVAQQQGGTYSLGRGNMVGVPPGAMDAHDWLGDQAGGAALPGTSADIPDQGAQPGLTTDINAGKLPDHAVTTTDTGLLPGAATKPHVSDRDLFLQLARANQAGEKRNEYQPLVGRNDWRTGWDNGLSNGLKTDLHKMGAGRGTTDITKELMNLYYASQKGDQGTADRFMNQKINPLTGQTIGSFLNFNKDWESRVENNLANQALAHITGLAQTSDPRAVDWFKATFPDWKERAGDYAKQYLAQYRQNETAGTRNAAFNYTHQRNA